MDKLSYRHRFPTLARMLRGAAKLAWWTATGQLLARLRARRRARTEAAIARETAFETALGRLEVLERRTAEFQGALGRLEVLERRAAGFESLLNLERGRIDWALGSVEGVTAQIDAYHAYRETDEYRAAYATAVPLVSVCMATLDRAELLIERSIASVLAQTHRNLQIVVVGDNCTDDTMQRLAALGDSRI
jgi:Glycosyl transferase family 2